MSFIVAKPDHSYVNTKYVACLDIYVTATNAKIEADFVGSQLNQLRDEVQDVLNVIDDLIECRDSEE